MAKTAPADTITKNSATKKSGARMMKSLRKTMFLACAAALGSGHSGGAKPDFAGPPWQAGRPLVQQGSLSAAQANSAQVKIRIPVNQVIVPVTVKDGAGRLVPDLRKEEFRVLEDKIEQRISYFSVEASPLSMVLLVDNDLKSRDAKEVSESLRSIVAGLSADDEAFVCRFDQFFHPGKGFTSDQDKLLTELKRTRLDEEPSVAPSGPAINNGPTINGRSATSDAPNTAGTVAILKGQSTKALDDAVYAAAQLLKDRDPERQRRKIIFLISDGVNAPKFNTNHYDTVLKELLRYNIAVYGVGVGSAFFNRRFERLAQYARDTGGEVYYGMKSHAMEELYAKVTEEARNQYTLAYAPTGTDRSAEYHSIEVRVRREGLTILTREGYYAGSMPR